MGYQTSELIGRAKAQRSRQCGAAVLSRGETSSCGVRSVHPAGSSSNTVAVDRGSR